MKETNYGWIIIGVGVLVNMTGLGFGRFAYSMLLPYMRESLGFNYIQMGFLSGGILLGYLVFSFIGGVLATRFGSKNITIASLLCGSLSMLFMGRISAFPPLLFFTFALGGSSAGVHISMTTLPMAWFGKRLLGKALGILTGGTGLGILLTGILLPPLLLSFGTEAWRDCWLLMALITFLVIISGYFLLKENPVRIDPHPVEQTEGNWSISAREKEDGLTLQSIFLIYFIFGFSYIIYATYFVAYMVEDLHLNEKAAGGIWAIFGWMSMVSGLIWGYLSDRFGREKALFLNIGTISLAVFLPLLFHQTYFLGASAFLFGSTFLGTVTIIAASIGDRTSNKKKVLYGLVTLIHGIGQLLGTISGGVLKDLTGSFRLTFLTALIGFLFCFILIVCNQKRYLILIKEKEKLTVHQNGLPKKSNGVKLSKE